MSNHYIVVADHGHLRIFNPQSGPGQMTPTLKEVQAVDFMQGRQSYTATDTDMAGRFQGSKQQGRGPGAPTARTGMSIDERLPMHNEMERRSIGDVVKAVSSFLSDDPAASWDFAAGPSVHNAVLERLPPEVRSRMRNSVAKDLVHQAPAELLSHFETRRTS